MLDTRYLRAPEHIVKDKDDFYKSGVDGASVLRGMVAQCRRLFVVPDSCVMVYVLGESNSYLIRIVTNDVRKDIIGRVYYLPDQKRVDIYDTPYDSVPLIAWKEKKLIWSNHSMMLQKLAIDRLFLPIISLT